jgi:hypothetical protein
VAKINGVFPAVVTDNVDPDNQGRVKVRLPQMGEPDQPDQEAWARLATLMAGQNRGTWFIPDVSDEVLVAFEGGDARRPYVIGSLWNAANTPPESMDSSNNKKLLRSRNGVTIGDVNANFPRCKLILTRYFLRRAPQAQFDRLGQRAIRASPDPGARPGAISTWRFRGRR